MIWHNSLKDAQPVNNQVILASVDGVCYLTVFDSERNVYVLKDDEKQFFDPLKQSLYWVSITDAPFTMEEY
jgi:hypothetical protein